MSLRKVTEAHGTGYLEEENNILCSVCCKPFVAAGASSLGPG